MHDSSTQPQFDINAPDPGRPRKIEELSNFYLIHPLSRRLVSLLILTPITPNTVSVSGALTAFIAATCFYFLDWPTGALAGFAFMFLTHVLDGSDGRLARITGRTSPNGEVIDGLCDHIGFSAVYVAMALVLARDIGAGPAWSIAVLAGISNILQAGSYEYRRRTYNHVVHGRPWLRNRVKSKADGSDDKIEGAVFTSIARFFLFLQNYVAADDPRLDQAITELTSDDSPTTKGARGIYRRSGVLQVRLWSALGQNHKTIAIFMAMLAGSPLYFFLYVATVLNVVLGILIWRQRRINIDVLAQLMQLQNTNA